MRAEQELQFMSDLFSSIFPTRMHALNHLFCVLGNGMEWKNGELIEKDGKYHNRYKMIEEIEKAEFPSEDNWYDMREFYKDLYESEDKPDKIPMEYDFEWYPLDTKYSKLYTFPEDIKPDWARILLECRDMLVKDNIHVDDTILQPLLDRRKDGEFIDTFNMYSKIAEEINPSGLHEDGEIPEAKSLRWLANQFPYLKEAKDDGDRMIRAINVYATAGADKIESLARELNKLKKGE